MGSYEIVMTPDAVADLIELRDYIAGTLSAPETALKYIRTIRREISTLSEMPGRIKTVDEEPWHSRGLRRLIVKNFIVYYRVEESAKKVYVLAVIYGKRDQLRMLSEIDP
ncbi:MAG: type II toxin-antitoxin system RelE/ParE family toxin [Clostridia bacterium]|nr:type II toxin-antitoxin system RelE/ParE family toxin [Clostridia bacterium]MBR0510667.1 type II toxin-antitoxin system RelE/ParE family toxin [Clostridia bacterium]